MLRVLAAALILCTPGARLSAGDDSTTPKKEAEVNLTPGPKATPELVEALLRADHELFAAVFDTCDVARLKDLVTDDFEFFHDKGGLVSTSGAQFVKDIENKCIRQREGVDFLSRRELVRESPSTRRVTSPRCPGRASTLDCLHRRLLRL